MRRNKTTTINTQTYDISSPIEINATAWRDQLGNWKNISLNMFMTDDEDEDSTNGIVLVRNKRLRDFARTLRMKDANPWYIRTYEQMNELLETYKTTSDTLHFATNRIQLPVQQAMGSGRCAYTNTACLFVEPADNQEDPFVFLFINDAQYHIVLNQECTDKQKAKGGASRGEYNEVA